MNTPMQDLLIVIRELDKELYAILHNEGIIETALAREKDEIMKAHFHNKCLNEQTFECSVRVMKEAEKYYNQMY